MKLKSKNILFISIITSIIILSYFFFFRIDLTSDKRYSIAPQTKLLMQQIDDPLEIIIYLEGDLNPGFLRLKKATSELLEELSVYSKKKIKVYYDNPSSASSYDKRQEKYAELEGRGLTPTMVYERDKEGKHIQKIIFPWAEITYGNRTLAVNLLKNIRGNTGEQNLNISIENLEFEITDAIRILTTKGINKIAFIEGHGELSEEETYDISKDLSKYFQIDRGTLGNDASALNDYKVIIIAKPTEPFSESDKYIIDQYIMNGGRVLWLVDGVKIAREELSVTGTSPAVESDVNLKDMLFRYGVRIAPVLLQDMQSVSIPVNIAPVNEQPHFELMPWIYAPLLLTSYAHPVTRNIAEVKAEFASAVELVGENPQINAYLLLATSDNTHIVRTPGIIDLNDLSETNAPEYFNTGYVPVAVSLEGMFPSVFANRIPSKDIYNNRPYKKESIETRQIVIANGDIIRNEISGNDIVPLGFDRVMNQQFGNKDFIQNAVLYLADHDGWMDLRSRTIKLSLLNKKSTQENKTFWQIINVLFPLIVLFIFGVIYQLVRKRKYQL